MHAYVDAHASQVKTWKQFKSPKTNEWIKKSWYIFRKVLELSSQKKQKQKQKLTFVTTCAEKWKGTKLS